MTLFDYFYMSYQPSSRAQSERIGIWTVAILVVIGVIWAVIRFVPSTAPASTPPASVSTVSSSDHIKGDGQVPLIEYSDFQCPACKSYYPIMKQLSEEYKDRIVFVYRYF